MHRPRGGAVEIDHRRFEGREDHHFVASAGHRHVQAPPATLAIERPEVHRHHVCTRFGGPEADAQNDQVALVTLHGLQILHHDGLRQVVLEERLDLTMFAPSLIEQIFDKLLLLGIERDDADRLPGRDEHRDRSAA